MTPDWISVEEAWERIDACVPRLPVEQIDLADVTGRVLAHDVCADRDFPAFARSAMDGFAVRANEVAQASPDNPVALSVRGESRPGQRPEACAEPNSCMRIMTGAPLPPDFDAVVPVEMTSGFSSDPVHIKQSVPTGKHIAAAGIERKRGEVVYTSSTPLHSAAAGILAMLGCSHVEVFRQPRVAILATGDELVGHDETLDPFRIRNSNSPMLRALTETYCREVCLLGPVVDDEQELDKKIQKGLGHDLLLITGGVSMGAYDYVKAALQRHQVRLHFERVALQPGKPVTFGVHDDGAVLALPGNPVSALTTFRLFGIPVMLRMQGASPSRPLWHRALADFEWKRRNDKYLVLPGRLSQGRVQRVPYTGSGDLLSFSRANCQIMIPPTCRHIEPGEIVSISPL